MDTATEVEAEHAAGSRPPVTGFPKAVRALVAQRANEMCERCGAWTDAPQYHHRRPRGAGGSRAGDTNTASNCLYLCALCHRITEDKRDRALFYGHLIRQGRNPAQEPVWWRDKWVLFNTDGTTTEYKEEPKWG